MLLLLMLLFLFVVGMAIAVAVDVATGRWMSGTEDSHAQGAGVLVWQTLELDDHSLASAGVGHEDRDD